MGIFPGTIPVHKLSHKSRWVWHSNGFHAAGGTTWTARRKRVRGDRPRVLLPRKKHGENCEFARPEADLETTEGQPLQPSLKGSLRSHARSEKSHTRRGEHFRWQLELAGDAGEGTFRVVLLACTLFPAIRPVIFFGFKTQNGTETLPPSLCVRGAPQEHKRPRCRLNLNQEHGSRHAHKIRRFFLPGAKHARIKLS